MGNQRPFIVSADLSGQSVTEGGGFPKESMNGRGLSNGVMRVCQCICVFVLATCIVERRQTERLAADSLGQIA